MFFYRFTIRERKVPVWLNYKQVVAVLHSDKPKSTMIVTADGSEFYVEESVNVVLSRLGR